MIYTYWLVARDDTGSAMAQTQIGRAEARRLMRARGRTVAHMMGWFTQVEIAPTLALQVTLVTS